MFELEDRGDGCFKLWVRNEHGREPLGEVLRDAGRKWYYRPQSGSYLYAGALINIAEKLMLLEQMQVQTSKDEQLSSEDRAFSHAERRDRKSTLSLLENDESDTRVDAK